MTDTQNLEAAQTSQTARPTNAIPCSCGAWWTGLGRAHCPACHETFSCDSAADKHRIGTFGIDRRCAHPNDVGLVARTKTCGDLWGWPSSDTYDPASRRESEES